MRWSLRARLALWHTVAITLIVAGTWLVAGDAAGGPRTG